MAAHPFAVLWRAQAQAHRQIERQDHADGHGFAVHEGIAVAGLDLQRVAERVAQVKQGPPPRFPLVVGDDGGLGGAAREHGMAAGVGVAVQQAPAVGLQPGEEGRVIQNAVLDHLGVAGPKLPRRQGVQRRDVGEHQARLVKSADQVLAVGRVDAGLPAHGAVHLGEQGRRHLHAGQSAQRDGGGEAGDVADHAAA